LDNFITGSRECFPDSVDVVEGDAADSKIVANCLKEIDGVFHLAAIPSVKIAQEDPLLVMRCGEMSLVNVLQECLKNHSIKRLVFASSAAVYGNPQFLPITEEHPANPISNYGVGKLACEHYLRAACAIQQRLDAVSLRFFNVFGPGQGEDSSYSGVITKFVAAIRGGKQPIIYGDGKQTRDFIPVQIIVSVCREVMVSNYPYQGQAMNLGLGKPTSINNLLKMLNSNFSDSADPVYKPESSFEIKKSYSDNIKIKRVSKTINSQINIEDYLKTI
jgi:UDP-glucose 4-epimerase